MPAAGHGEIREYLRAGDIIRAAVLVTVVVLLFLLSPTPATKLQRPSRLTVVELGGPLHVVKNVDSWEFEHVAAHPGDILTLPHRHRQNRPLYVAMGWLLALPFRAAGMESQPMFSPAVGKAMVKKPPFPSAYNRYSPEYAGMILLNWLLLVASVLLLKPLMRARSFFEPRMLLPLSMLLANAVTKPFFWTPHLQIFSVFLAVASMCLFRAMQPRLRTMRGRDAALIGLACGVAALAYGAFAVTIAGASLCILFGDGLQTLRRQLGRKLFLCACLVASFFAPLLAWTAFVIFWMGSFYSQETHRFREFVWIFDSLSRGLGSFISDLARNVSNYVGKTNRISLVPALLISTLIVLFYGVSTPEKQARADDDTRRAVIFYAIATIGFYSLMGFYDQRLSWTLVPALLVVLGLEAARVELGLTGKSQRLFRIVVDVWVIAYVGRFILKSGPYL